MPDDIILAAINNLGASLGKRMDEYSTRMEYIVQNTIPRNEFELYKQYSEARDKEQDKKIEDLVKENGKLRARIENGENTMGILAAIRKNWAPLVLIGVVSLLVVSHYNLSNDIQSQKEIVSTLSR